MTMKAELDVLVEFHYETEDDYAATLTEIMDRIREYAKATINGVTRYNSAEVD